MNDTGSHNRDGKPSLVLAWIGVCALVNLITPQVVRESRQPELPALFLGMAAGQPALLAIWAVLGPQPLLVRWSLSLPVTALLWGMFLLGVAVSGYPETADLARATLMLPLILLAVQLPLWLLKLATGWQIVAEGTHDSRSSAELRQFRLQRILGATTVVAVALGLAGLGLPRVGRSAADANVSLWLGLMFACLIVCVFSGLSTLPCLWAAFAARDKAGATVAIAVFAAAMIVLATAVIAGAAGPVAVVAGLRVFVPLLGGLALMLLGSLHFARSCGYVLLRPGRMAPPAETTGTSPFAQSSQPPPSIAPNDAETEPRP